MMMELLIKKYKRRRKKERYTIKNKNKKTG
jgi:hypothetical protein